MKRFLGPFFIFLAALAGLLFLLSKSDDARDVIGTATLTFFTFLTTPFIMESSIALLGLVALLTYNQWRLQKDGPEWVEMEVPDKTASQESSDVK